MEDQYLVSVIIPTYNRAKYLPEAIASIQNQGFESIQIIVIDDGSTDNTRELMAEYGNQVTYLFQENQGPGKARNTGLEVATGKYIAFLDSDDLWLPKKLSIDLAFFEQDPALEAIISDATFYREGVLEIPSRFGVSKMTPMPQEPTLFRWESRGWAFGGGVCATCCMILKRSGLLKLEKPYFEPSISSYEDWDLEMRVYYHCKVLINPQIVAKVRRFADGTREERPAPESIAALKGKLLAIENQVFAMGKFLKLNSLPAYARKLGEERQEELEQLALSLVAKLNQEVAT